MMHDLRYAIRRLARRPGVAVIIVLSLGLGIGANSALYGLFNALFFRPPPGLGDTDELVWVMAGERFANASYPDYRDFRESSDEVLSGLAAYMVTDMALGSGGEPVNVTGQMVSANYFDVLGATPEVGRGFIPGEEGLAETPRVAVISHSMWQTRFGGDPDLAGRTIILNGHPFSLAGIAPEGFVGTRIAARTDVWVPIQSQPVTMPRSYDLLGDRSFPQFWMIGRLGPGTSPAEAEAALGVIAERINPLEPERIAVLSPAVSPLRGWMPVDELASEMLAAMALAAIVTGLVLLIVCANIANLLLARAARRTKETGIRLALGAGRARLIRQMLSESVVLALAGGVVGILVASWSARWFSMRFSDVFGTLDVSPGTNTLLFTLAVALGSALLCGLVPALRASRGGALPAIRGKAASRGSRSRLQSSLVIAQIALSLVLLVTAGLFLRKFQRVATADLGFDAERVLAMSFNLTAQGYTPTEIDVFHDELEHRIRLIPGVMEATSSSTLRSLNRVSRLDGSQAAAGSMATAKSAAAVTRGATPEFFRTLGLDILRGRAFTAAENHPDAPAVAVISESLARRLWPEGGALGGRISFSYYNEPGTPIRIIGIARDAALGGFGEREKNMIYRPMEQYLQADESDLLVRTVGDPLETADDVRAIIRSMAPGLPVYNVETLAERVDSRIRVFRDLSGVFTGFGFLALALAVLGLYGVISFTVAGRTREIGIRMAIGAPRGQVLRRVLRDGLRLTIIGLVMGGLLSLAVGQLVASIVSGINSTDSVTLIVVAAVLTGAAMIACYLPGRRAARVDPMAALRYE